MQIKLEQTKYYKYAFIYDFNMEKLEFCRYIKNKVGGKTLIIMKRLGGLMMFLLLIPLKADILK